MERFRDADELANERLMIERAQRDLRQFDQLYERYFNRVYAFAVSRTSDRASAEDVTSETFRRALQGLPRFKWQEVPFSAWLFRIASNVCTDLVQTRARDAAGAAMVLLDASQGWESEVEEKTRLFEQVDRLPPQQKRVVVLRFVEQKSLKETATCLGKSEGTVKQLQQRALRELRRRMRGEED